jgi:hypothetical protein
MSCQQNRAQFLAWLRGAAPAIYRDCVPQMAVEDIGEYSGIGGFWDSVGTTFSTVVTNVTNALPQIANTYSQYQSQRELIKSNTQRASQGLPPLRYEGGQLVTANGLPYTADEYTLAGRGGSMTTIALIGAVAVIALLALRK